MAGTIAVAGAGLVGGVPAGAVSGGSPVTDPAFAFAARLAFGDDRVCSGALVSAQWVITARSCLSVAGAPVVAGPPARPTTVTVGRLDLTTTAGQVRTVNRVVPHPSRNIALVRLAGTVPGIRPVTLGTTAPAAGDTLRAVGFGRTATEWIPDQLHGVDVAVAAVTTTGLDVANQDGSGPTTCRGDAGGPTVRTGGANPELVAVHDTSWQGGCFGEAETRRNAVEARTDDLATWIRQNTPANCNAQGGTAGTGDQATVVLPGDFTGDCKDDVLGQLTTGDLRLYQSSGTIPGTLFPTPFPTVGAGWTAAEKPRVIVGDFNGDGKSDLMAQWADGDLMVWPSTGDPSRLFSPGRLVGSPWTTTQYPRIFPGDFNGDGKTDLIGQTTTGDLWLWPSTGDLSADNRLFTSSTRRLVGGGWTTTQYPRIFPGDFNGDGRTDLIGQVSNGELWAWASSGDVSADNRLFTGRRTVGGNWAISVYPRVVPADLDGDGITDLLAHGTDGTLRAYRSTGDLSADNRLFPKPHPIVGAPWDKASKPRMIVGDMTGDGRADLLGQSADGTLTGFESTGDMSADNRLFAGNRGTVGTGWTTSALPRLF
ncbi:FG-GAP-like repeat-containing protein [Micromonospora sp. RP3T]|uniref:FG-GAP-like repeat-containing protein n=1 Tax=Micromonospora sp. RP3T TaxID=2135446 RepID=UPI001304C55D|nr:FG-GAP-like repeat-containing protein [Micromonospora sp. RP3T]